MNHLLAKDNGLRRLHPLARNYNPRLRVASSSLATNGGADGHSGHLAQLSSSWIVSETDGKVK